MEENPKKMRFSEVSLRNLSCSPNQITPLFSCQPNRTDLMSSLPSDIINSDSSSELSSSIQTSSDHRQDRRDEDQNKEINSGHERLKRHREEVAGHVLVPDKWGKEELMKDWIDYASFDKLLVPNGIRTAREALVVEAAGRRRPQAPTTSSTSPPLRIESRCY
ncbi:hypothetical protein PanWU01x14_289870 [Parasponia andersonii]|uniref:Protein BIC1 n=1 Tax=Parasponia andersonii TaxID=3476 RepID=A0A2P5AXW9_PARAD|nr:hypothetical protein PanWU01x14_289870 [Parasponia andersonii]